MRIQHNKAILGGTTQLGWFSSAVALELYIYIYNIYIYIYYDVTLESYYLSIPLINKTIQLINSETLTNTKTTKYIYTRSSDISDVFIFIINAASNSIIHVLI